MLSQCLILQAHREFIVFDPHVFPRSSRERERESEILFGENFSIKVLWNRQVDGQQREHHSRDENFVFIGKSIKEWTYKKLGGSVHIIKQILSDLDPFEIWCGNTELNELEWKCAKNHEILMFQPNILPSPFKNQGINIWNRWELAINFGRFFSRRLNNIQRFCMNERRALAQLSCSLSPLHHEFIRSLCRILFFCSTSFQHFRVH